MKQAKHLSMIRSFHLADWFTLGNAACGVGALFAVMSYLQSQDVQHLLFACALILLAFATKTD
jgi:CDP-diacylglycerol--serine O-phosphatidyltransferase